MPLQGAEGHELSLVELTQQVGLLDSGGTYDDNQNHQL